MNYFNRELAKAGLFQLGGLTVDVYDISSIVVDGIVIRVFIRAGDTVYERNIAAKSLTKEEVMERYLDCLEAKAIRQSEEHNYWNNPSTGLNAAIGTNTCNTPDLPHNQDPLEPSEMEAPDAVYRPELGARCTENLLEETGLSPEELEDLLK